MRDLSIYVICKGSRLLRSKNRIPSILPLDYSARVRKLDANITLLLTLRGSKKSGW